MAVTTGSDEVRAVRNLELVMDFALRSHARAALLLVILALLCMLPGFFAIPPTDRDEARFAQATKQMIESGDYIDIRFQDEVRYKKPVGIYWLQAAAVKAGSAVGIPNAHTTIWLYRIPSLIGAIGAVLLTYWAALAMVTRRAAVLAGLMMACCVLLTVEARIAKTDAMLLAASVAALGVLARLYLPEQRQRLDARSGWLLPAIFWTALAAGVLLKGPVIGMFVGLAVVALVVVDRSARWLIALRPFTGLVWFALLVLPWFVAITMRAGDDFFAESVGKDLFSKILSGQESHGAPPGYYFLLFWMTFFPGAILAGLAIPAIIRARREPGTKLLLAWIVPSWLLLELVVTKLPHYVLPAYPAIAILFAGVVDAGMLSRARSLTIATIWWFLVPLLAGLAGLGVLIFIGRQFGLLAWLTVGGSAVMGLLAWRLYEADGAEQSLFRVAAATVLLEMAALGLIVPRLSPAFPSVTLARILRSSDCSEPAAASAGFHEPSLVFLAGTATRLTDAPGAADFLRGGDCRYAFIEAREERGFVQRAEAVGLAYSQVTRFEAFNLGSGRAITLSVFRSRVPQ